MAIVYAKTTRVLQDRDGLNHPLVFNTPWDADDPLVKDNPSFFQDRPMVVHHTVEREEKVLERATAAPGEKRPYIKRTPREEAPVW